MLPIGYPGVILVKQVVFSIMINESIGSIGPMNGRRKWNWESILLYIKIGSAQWRQ
jgi:hypothetical protein